MFSMTTIASSTTNPVAMVRAISERLSMLYPQRYITPNVPISEMGTATLGMKVARAVAQEEEDHQDDQADRQQQRNFDVVDRGADGGRAIQRDARCRSPRESPPGAAASAR